MTSRDEIKKELLAFVDSKLAASANWDVVESGDGTVPVGHSHSHSHGGHGHSHGGEVHADDKFEARQNWEEEGIVTVTKLQVPDLDLSKIATHPFFSDYDTGFAKLSSKASNAPKLTRLPDIEGATAVRHMKVETPWPITNRSVIPAYYHITGDDGSFTFLASSRGNDSIVEAEKERIGSDVIATMIVNYHRFSKGKDGKGVQITTVLSFDPNGYIPNMLKKKMAGKQVFQSRHLANYLRDGTVSSDW